ncbi:hypothetical protein Ciccas_005512 [Cichlidogyrus casuarinus]|uniref:Helix-turn-helix domain-containing protein n=1 Tax=Cichlidogyrus casuarinus TaxID=1844966 RepID=A0ABD2Q8G0_9PLAT
MKKRPPELEITQIRLRIIELWLNVMGVEESKEAEKIPQLTYKSAGMYPNNTHPSMRFTMEESSKNEMPFLDVLFEWSDNGKVSRRVHRKETWTGRMLHFQFFSPIAYKRSVVIGATSRTRRICSSDTVDEWIPDQVHRS